MFVSIKTRGKTEGHLAKFAGTQAGVSIKVRRPLLNTTQTRSRQLTVRQRINCRESTGEGTSVVRSIGFLNIDITRHPRGVVVAKPHPCVRGRMALETRCFRNHPFLASAASWLWSNQALIIDRTPAVRSARAFALPSCRVGVCVCSFIGKIHEHYTVLLLLFRRSHS